MKTFRFVFFLFYRYYSKRGTKAIPYFSTLCAISLLFFLHVLQLLIIFDAMDYFPISGNESRILRYGKIALLSIPVFLIISFLVRPKEVRNMSYDEAKIKKGNILLLLYVLAAVVLLFWLLTTVRPSATESEKTLIRPIQTQ